MTKRLVTVSQKICTRDFAFDQHRMGGVLPPNGVGHFATDAGLFGEDHATAISPQPRHGSFHQLRVSHAVSVRGGGRRWK